MTETKIELLERKSRPTYGGMKLEVTYAMTVTKNQHIKNTYRVTCEIRGLDTADPHLSVESAEWIGDMETESNEETLTEQGAMDLFEEMYI